MGAASPCHCCGRKRKLTPQEQEAKTFADEYEAFVGENRTVIDRIVAIIEKHVAENKPGDPFDVYAWPESEAVVILQHWDDLRASVSGRRT